jgi:hypothetical protein
MVRLAGVILIISAASCSHEYGPPLVTEVYSPTVVYYGNAIKYTRPAEIHSLEVFKQIPEYRRIRTENLTPHDAEYHLLLSKACEIFYSHLTKIASQKSVDLIVEKGMMSFTKPSIDITKDVLDRLVKAGY